MKAYTISNSIVATNHSRFIPKRIPALLLSLICVLTLAACAGGGTPPVDNSISVLNLRVIPAANNATLIWDNPNATIQHINISYKASTEITFREMIITDSDKRARSEVNRSEVLPILPVLTFAVGFTFNVRLKLEGADANKTVSTKSITWLIGPNLDGDEYADADALELDEDGDGTNDDVDAFPRNDDLSAFAVTELSATPGDREVTLSWNNPAANISSISISYHNTSAPNTLQYFPLITNSTKIGMNAMNVQQVIGNLTNGEFYTFNVTLTLRGADVGKEVMAQSVNATPDLSTVRVPPISVLNLQVIPDTTNATLIWDNPDADIASISISYKVSTATGFESSIPLITDSPAIDRNAMDVRGAIPFNSLTPNTNYTFRVALELEGDDENRSTDVIEITWLIGPNLDGDDLADAVDEDDDGDGVNDEQDAFPRNDALFAFTVTDLTARPGNEEVTLSWTNPVANISSISINYYNTNTPNNLQSHLLIEDSSQTSSGATDVEETIPNLENGQSYTFTVSLTLDEDDADKGVSAASTSATPNLFTVMGLDARPGDSSVTLSWTNPAATIASINISYYNSNTPNDLQYPALIEDSSRTTATMYVEETITDLENEQYYTFIVNLTLGGDDTGNEGEAQSIEVAIGADADGDGLPNSLDVDDDGDGLIEISTAEQLNQSRHNLLGSSFKASPGDAGDDEGCGNGTIAGEDVTACNGYELSANISLADYNNWEPIGGCLRYDSIACTPISSLFNAILNGNGYIISNLTIIDPAGDYDNASGLFGAISRGSVLHNVHIRSANLSGGENNMGLLVGYARGASISNSSAEGEVSASGNNVGGLVGNGDNGKITSSYASGGSVSGNRLVGGLVGNGNTGKITSSYASGGSVSGTAQVGGLVGQGQNAIITSSYASGSSVVGSASNVGGLIGNGFISTITSSYAAGVNVSGTTEVGGLVGNGNTGKITSSYASDGSVVGSNDAVGGLVGFGGDSTITSSYAANISVSGIFFVGGLVGNGNNAIITSSYAAGSISGSGSIGGLVGGGPINAASSNFYWDNETSGVTVTIGNAEGADEGRSTNDLRDPENAAPNTVYVNWDDDTCTDGSLAWDFGTAMQYPALTCTPNGLSPQR